MSCFINFDSVTRDKNYKSGFIVRSGIDYCFYIFEDIDAYLRRKSLSDSPCWHEVIEPHKPHKFFIDLDFEVKAKTLSLDKLFDVTVKIAAWALIDTFNEYYKKNIIEDEIAYVDSCGNSKGGYKYSKNLILLNYAVCDQEEHSIVGKKVLEKFKKMVDDKGLGEEIFRKDLKGKSSDFFDEAQLILGKYNNRLPGCTKYVDGKSEERFKTWDISLHNERDLIITNVENCIILRGPNRYDWSNRVTHDIEIEDEKIKEILNLTNQYWRDSFEYDGVKNNIICFKRFKSSYCPLCKREHEHDNSLYIIVSNEYACVRCRRPNKGEDTLIKAIYIGDPEEKPKGIKKKPQKEIPIEKIFYKGRKTHIDDSKTINYDIAFMNSSRIKCIKAEMKMFKTTNNVKKVKGILEENPNSRIILCSFRRTFSFEAKRSYPDFTHYENIEKKTFSLAEYSQIIIQLESLHRIDVAGSYRKESPSVDLLILDEIESIWSQFSSSNHRDYISVVNIFVWIFANSKEIIIMDAHISQRTKNLLKILAEDEPFYYINTFNPSRDIRYTFSHNANDWIPLLGRDTEEGKNIMIFTNTIKFAKKIEQYLKILKIQEHQIMTYSSETLESIKREHFSNVDDYWSRYRIVICTPTVTAGVSFGKKYFDVVYGYFVDSSCNVYTCMQMIGRVRNIKDNLINICTIKTQEYLFETSVTKIEENLINNRAELVTELNNKYNIGSLDYNIQSDASIQYNKTFKYWITVENIAYDNESKNNFGAIYRSVIRNLGHEIIDNDEVDCAEFYISQFNLAGCKSDKLEYAGFTSEPYINKDAYDAIIERKQTGADVHVSEIVQVKKYRLINELYYSYKHEFRNNLNISKDTFSHFYENKKNMLRCQRTKELFEVHPFEWNGAIKAIYDKEIKYLKGLYNKSCEIDYNSIKFKSDYHKRIKDLFDNYPNKLTITIKDIIIGDYDRSVFLKTSTIHKYDEFQKLAYKTGDVLFHKKFHSKVKDADGIESCYIHLCNILKEFYLIGTKMVDKKPKIQGDKHVLFKDGNFIYCNGKQVGSDGKTFVAKNDADLPTININ